MQDKKPVIYNTSRFQKHERSLGKEPDGLPFAATEGRSDCKTSVSAVSTAGAQLNMQELDGMTFDGLKEKVSTYGNRNWKKYRVTADRKTKRPFIRLLIMQLCIRSSSRMPTVVSEAWTRISNRPKALRIITFSLLGHLSRPASLV